MFFCRESGVQIPHRAAAVTESDLPSRNACLRSRKGAADLRLMLPYGNKSLFFAFVEINNEGEKPNMKRKQTLIAVAAALLLLLGSLAAWTALRPQEQVGSKTITVRVDHLVGEDKSFTIHTDEEYLRAALDSVQLIDGSEQEYGLWVTTVDGEVADDAQQQWWGYDVNGEMGQYGVDQQVIADGDVYDFTLHVGW